MSRFKQVSSIFFVLGFCSCLALTGLIRYASGWSERRMEHREATVAESDAEFYKNGTCPTCRLISTKHWKVGRLKDNNDLHLESARRLGITPFETNADFEAQISGFLRRRKLKKVEDDSHYRVQNLTHSYPYLVPEAIDLMEEIGKRFQTKLKSLGIDPHYLLVSSVLRTMESQYGLGKRNANATKNMSAHLYGTTIDITYKEFLPMHETHAPEGFCRHDMLRHPLAEVLTELSSEGRCRVVQEVRQACYHITVNR